MKKRLFLTFFFISLLSIIFWTSSRYPQLDEKAAMEGEVHTVGISFDVVKFVDTKDPIYSQIFWNTVNWIDTNKKGMLFGVLFASAIILLFAQIGEKQFKSKWLNSATGMLLGAPLGVCVNCAAPIAKGIKDSGGRSEIALATMISSPTLNVVVLSMLISLFPIYMVVIKLSLTLIVILVFIPLLVSLFDNKQTSIASEITGSTKFTFSFMPINISASENWLGTFKWFLGSYSKSLWFIVKTAVPLMFLAGLLGNVLITLIPLEHIVEIIPNHGFLVVIISLIILSFIGVFLPVPMAFDIIVVTTLMNAGLQVKYAMALLFTLGIFSIYSFLIVQKSIGFKIASSLFVIIAGLGAFSGVMAHIWQTRFLESENQVLLESYHRNSKSSTYLEINHAGSNLEPQSIGFERYIDPKTDSIWHINESIQISRRKFAEKKQNTDKWFEKIEAGTLGLDPPYKYSMHSFTEPFGTQKSIASGDLHGDGYPDIVMASAGSLFVFANNKGKGFLPQKTISLSHIKNIYTVALVDINNDGSLDIFFSTFSYGNYVIINESGSFEKSKIINMPIEPLTRSTYALGFGDLDRDGLIDIYYGNYHSNHNRDLSLDSSSNYGYYQKINGWEKFSLNGEGGETLSLLISDINMDGKLDIIEGNDYKVPDYYYYNQGNKKFKMIYYSDSIIEQTTLGTMSIASCDIDNDLVPELYLAEINRNYRHSSKSTLETCSCIKDPIQYQSCVKIFNHWFQFQEAMKGKNYADCPEDDIDACIWHLNYLEFTKNNPSLGQRLAKMKKYDDRQWEYYNNYYGKLDTTTLKYSRISSTSVKQGDSIRIPQRKQDEIMVSGDAVLQKRQHTGNFKYKNSATDYGINNTGWSWNAQFADLDNDSWQDLLIANGALFPATRKQYRNIFYHNKKGISFEDRTEELGFDSYLPTSAYTYFDFDLDGDLDIIMAPEIGPVSFYKNNTLNNAIIFQLRDDRGNSNGIGSKIFIHYQNGKKQYREILLSGGYKSFNEPIAHFGIGDTKEITQVEVHWSTGEKTIINEHLKAGYKYIIHRIKGLTE